MIAPTLIEHQGIFRDAYIGNSEMLSPKFPGLISFDEILSLLKSSLKDNRALRAR